MSAVKIPVPNIHFSTFSWGSLFTFHGSKGNFDLFDSMKYYLGKSENFVDKVETTAQKALVASEAVTRNANTNFFFRRPIVFIAGGLLAGITGAITLKITYSLATLAYVKGMVFLTRCIIFVYVIVRAIAVSATALLLGYGVLEFLGFSDTNHLARDHFTKLAEEAENLSKQFRQLNKDQKVILKNPNDIFAHLRQKYCPD